MYIQNYSKVILKSFILILLRSKIVLSTDIYIIAKSHYTTYKQMKIKLKDSVIALVSTSTYKSTNEADKSALKISFLDICLDLPGEYYSRLQTQTKCHQRISILIRILAANEFRAPVPDLYTQARCTVRRGKLGTRRTGTEYRRLLVNGWQRALRIRLFVDICNGLTFVFVLRLLFSCSFFTFIYQLADCRRLSPRWVRLLLSNRNYTIFWVKYCLMSLLSLGTWTIGPIPNFIKIRPVLKSHKQTVKYVLFIISVWFYLAWWILFLKHISYFNLSF